MEGTDKLLIAIMIIIVVVGGFLLLAPRNYAYTRSGGALSATVYNGSYATANPAYYNNYQNPYYTSSWSYTNMPSSRSSTSYTSYTYGQPQYYTYTTTNPAPNYQYQYQNAYQQYPQYQNQTNCNLYIDGICQY